MRDGMGDLSYLTDTDIWYVLDTNTKIFNYQVNRPRLCFRLEPLIVPINLDNQK